MPYPLPQSLFSAQLLPALLFFLSSGLAREETLDFLTSFLHLILPRSTWPCWIPASWWNFFLPCLLEYNFVFLFYLSNSYFLSSISRWPLSSCTFLSYLLCPYKSVTHVYSRKYRVIKRIDYQKFHHLEITFCLWLFIKMRSCCMCRLYT